MDKSGKIGSDQSKDMQNLGNPEVEAQSEDEEGAEMAVEDIRAHILDYYGVDPEAEQGRKEQKAQKFRSYVNNSGLQLAFQLVISEIMGNGVPTEEFFSYASKRMKEIGREYQDIKEEMIKNPGVKGASEGEGKAGGKKKGK
jgi:hypothetical protein